MRSYDRILHNYYLKQDNNEYSPYKNWIAFLLIRVISLFSKHPLKKKFFIIIDFSSPLMRFSINHRNLSPCNTIIFKSTMIVYQSDPLKFWQNQCLYLRVHKKISLLHLPKNPMIILIFCSALISVSSENHFLSNFPLTSH